jgi:hypothetical protein
LERPWHREDGLRSEDLVAAFHRNDVDVFRRLYQEAVMQEWFPDSQESKLCFLTIVHHVCTSKLRSPMAALVSRVKKGLDVSQTRQASDAWAAAVLRQSHKDQVIAREPQ